SHPRTRVRAPRRRTGRPTRPRRPSSRAPRPSPRCARRGGPSSRRRAGAPRRPTPCDPWLRERRTWRASFRRDRRGATRGSLGSPPPSIQSMAYIRAMIGAHDLDVGLLRALHALVAEQHVTHAATRLDVTQSALSHSLARLRRVFRDPLLVRTPAGMVPTE